ncbi:retinol dehydrogenase 7-like [Tubulanus polymorphus]|uniref:retinol dehydrogenase 7-like n=1 Tax=Tubulanus polymorphus TaxID=672921 RepID=UPI003DA3179C
MNDAAAAADDDDDVVGLVLDDDFLFYSVIYSLITVVFAMAILSKFFTNEFRFGVRSIVSLAVLFVGEPACHFFLKGPAGVMSFAVCCLFIYSILPASHLPALGKTVLITGCDSGFGYELAKKLDSIGMTVFAGCLNIEGVGAMNLKQTCSNKLEIVQLDVMKQDQIEAVFDIISKKSTGLWGLVNNAGIFQVGPIEMTSQEIIVKKVFDINFHGMVRTVRTFLPLLRQSRGRIVNMSSFTGRVPMEEFGVYVASKYAIEGYSDVLRLEMKKFGVKVSLVEPGGYKTNLAASLTMKEELWNASLPSIRDDVYGRKYVDDLFTNFTSVMKSCASDLTPVIRAYRSALLSKRPRERYACDLLGECVLAVLPVLPTWISDWFCHSLAIGRNLLPACLQNQQ